ncbi:F0F1 ATP synthase subunit B [Terrihabitans soli]|uniref:F0F1 ATP synthase subunit B n=1 Tax=Terrihabitans soli TaxID=708113 RepID=UPI003B82CD38
MNEMQPGATAPVESVHTEVHQAQEGHGGGFPPFESHTFASQILWLAITFGALYFLMSRIALPRVASILEVRSDRIASDLAEAQRLKTETEQAIAAYESSLAEARSKAQKIAGETRDKVQAEADTQKKKIEADLSERLAKAEKQIADTKAKALSNVRTIAVEAASDIVAQLLGDKPDAKDVETAVDATLKS